MGMGKMHRVYTAPKKVPEKVKTYVKNQIANVGEDKIYDASLGLGVSSTAGQLVLLSSAMTKGNNMNQRKGDEISMKSLEFRFQHRASLVATDIQRCRVVVFQDMSKGSSGTPAAATFLQTASDPLSPVNSDFTTNKRYRILYDKLFHLYTPDSSCVDVKRTIKIDRKAYWTDAGVANGGQIYVFSVIDNAAGAASQYAWYARLKFTDS